MKKTEKSNTNEIMEIPAEEAPYALPDGWKWVRLVGGFAECMDNCRKPVNADERESRKGDIPYYGATGQVGWINDYLTDEELVLLGEDGAPFFDLMRDKAYIIKGKAWVNNHAHILKALQGHTSNLFLLYYLNSFNFKGYVNGTTRLKLTQSSMGLIPVPLPPLKTQKRIVDRIESLFAKLDEAKEKAQTALDTFELRKSAILHKAFTGQLTAKWREENRAVAVTSEHSDNLTSTPAERPNNITSVSTEHLHNISSVPSSQSPKQPESINFPRNWKMITLKKCGDWSGGGTPSMAHKEYWENGNLLWITSKDMKSDEIEDTLLHTNLLGVENSSANYIIKPSLLFVMRSGILRRTMPIAMVKKPFTVNQDLKVVSPNESIICLDYLFWACKANEQKILATCMKNGTTVESINAKSLLEFQIPLATKDEQQEIVRILDDLLAKENAAKEAAEAVIEKIDLMKKSILARAFRGEL